MSARPPGGMPLLPGPGRAERGKCPARPRGFAEGGAAMDTLSQVRPGRARCRVAPAVLALLQSARQGLAEAAEEGGAGSRYVAAHLAALRAAAAIVAARPAARTSPRRKGPKSVWELLPQNGAGALGVGGVLRRWRAQAGRRGGGPGPGRHRR